MTGGTGKAPRAAQAKPKSRRVPVVPTVIVLLAAGVMVALGIWQLQRAEWKESLMLRYAEAENAPSVSFPRGADYERWLYRRSEVDCLEVLSRNAIAGRNRQGVAGLAQTATCDIGVGEPVTVRLGWTTRPDPVAWQGGRVTGWIISGRERASLIADAAPEGMEPLAKPDPADIPNNHLAYAGQWFFFAVTALVIYGFALRRRWRDQGAST